ncbi:MAG: aminoacyl-tRNA hydrolase [Planctomycetota bacterium]
MRLVVGLGNPGPEYADTRHNIGFEVVERLAEQQRASWRLESGVARVASLAGLGEPTWLVEPMTFMNRSGRALAKVLEKHPAEPESILVVCDDVHLPVATMRARRCGGTGGHNGLKSIEAYLETQEYPRLRIGVGGAPGEHLADHVLGRYSKHERKLLDDLMIDALAAVEMWVRTGDIDAVMNRYNG